tara:strand:- start:303 stop:548 length:246 start_codon:yes stop_codon:yes gene_type:complete
MNNSCLIIILIFISFLLFTKSDTINKSEDRLRIELGYPKGTIIEGIHYDSSNMGPIDDYPDWYDPPQGNPLTQSGYRINQV